MRRGDLIILCGVCLVLVGCQKRDYTGPTRFAVAGKVTCDGQPIDWGAISFLPKDGSQRVSGGLIQNGTYTIPEEKGTNAGPYRVEIRWLKLTGKKYADPDTGEMIDARKEALPPRFHEQSELKAEVSETQTVFDFDLKSK